MFVMQSHIKLNCKMDKFVKIDSLVVAFCYITFVAIVVVKLAICMSYFWSFGLYREQFYARFLGIIDYIFS